MRSTLALVADIPAEYAPGKRSRVVGLVDLPGQRFVFSLFDADAIWIADLSRRGARRSSPSSTASAASPTTRWSRPTAATTSPACSARTAWR